MDTIRISLVALSALGISLTGCYATPEEIEEFTQTTQSIVTSAEVTDSSGRVHVAVTQCDWVPAAEHPHATCGVDSSKYVLVGGGAEVENTGAGALLTGSYPCNEDRVTWCADSKDHKYVTYHRLRAYAIGLRIDGYASSTLRQLVHITPVTSGQSGTPGAFAAPYYAPYGGYDTLIGGGAKTLDWTNGILLTNSTPTWNGSVWGWAANGKAHQIADSGKVTAYAISIASTVLINDVKHVNSSTVSSGYASAVLPYTNRPTGMIPTSIGGYSSYGAGQGRLLTSMDLRYWFSPPSPSWDKAIFAQSKDHEYANSGYVGSYALYVRGI